MNHRSAQHAVATLAVIVGVSGLTACSTPHDQAASAGPDARTPLPADPGPREIFPHVRFDKSKRVIEFDGVVPIDCHKPTTPRVYLEVTACTRNSREHESLVMTDARPSHVHAALLLAGLIPGEPGWIRIVDKQLRTREPSGDGLRVTILYKDPQGQQIESSPLDWVIDTGTKEHLSAGASRPAWVFAGSRMITWQGQEFYDADNEGTLVGLTTFGSEVVALSRVLSPDSALQDPEWIADITRVPPINTPVVVRITGELAK